MKTYQVTLTKAYAVTINADGAEQAKRLAEFYTGDIQDISTNQNRKEHYFNIKQITCNMNEGFDVKEISDD